MADISMCQDKECHSRESCYRFMATADSSGWQSYMDFKCPAGADKCKDFLPLTRPEKTKNSSKKH